MSLHLIPAGPVGHRLVEHLSRGLGASVAAFFSLFAGMATEALSQDTLPAVQEPKVLVWRQVRNDFFNPNLPSEVVSQMVERTPPTLLTIAPGDTVSAQLQRSFNVSSTRTPKMYKELTAKIRDLNGNQNLDKVVAGTALLVPQIPKAVLRNYATASPLFGQNVRTSLEWTGASVAGQQFTRAAPFNVAPQAEMQFFSVPTSEAQNYLVPGLVQQGISGPLVVQLEQNPTSTVSSSQVLSPAASEVIRLRLANVAADAPSPILVIVDDSIPDSAEYAKARTLMLEISEQIRDKYKLGPSPYVAELLSQPSALVAEDPATLYPNARTHSALIKHALVEMTALDPSNRVTVVYIPLAATQVGVAPLLKELLYLAQMLKVVRPTLPPLVTADQSQRAQARNATEVILKGNPGAFVAGLPQAISGASLTMTTDHLLLEALSIVFSYYSDISLRPHSLSFSWTTPKLSLPAYFEPSSYGWKFAAAGNKVAGPKPETDFVELGLQFASRAASPKDFFVVLNSTGDKSGCPSNTFNDTDVHVLSVSFPGETAAGKCGTSFSTPRVAWLVAAREVAFGKRLPTPLRVQSKVSWQDKHRAAIAGFRDAAATGLFERYRLDVEKYFSK